MARPLRIEFPGAIYEEGQGLPSLWTNLQQQIYLGSDEFIERLQSRLLEKEFSEVPKVQRRIIRSLQWYKHQHSNPKVAMVKAYESGAAYTLAQIAGHFGVHYSTVSRAVK